MDTIKVTLSVEGPAEAALDALAQASVYLWAAQAAANDATARYEAVRHENHELRSEAELSRLANEPSPVAPNEGPTPAR